MNEPPLAEFEPPEFRDEMDSGKFRTIFARTNHMLPVMLLNGALDLAVGLNGENVVLHKAGTMPLACFSEGPSGGELIQHSEIVEYSTEKSSNGNASNPLDPQKSAT